MKSEVAHRRSTAELLYQLRRRGKPVFSFEIALDRGCFHYLPVSDRLRYESELRRVLTPGGRLLLRASLRAAGVRNDISEDVIRATFAKWDLRSVERAEIPSDTRLLEVLMVRLERRR